MNEKNTIFNNGFLQKKIAVKKIEILKVAMKYNYFK